MNRESPWRRVFRWIAAILAAIMLVADYVIDRLGADWMQQHSKNEVELALADFILTFGPAIAAFMPLIVILDILRTWRRKRHERRQLPSRP